MNTMAQIVEGLTYDDVLLVPAYSEVLPHTVSIASKFTRNIIINTPIVTAAMDTVTESALAIAIAREGGIGVLHKNMSIEAQAAEVRKVKRSESGMIQDPVTISKVANVGDALQLMKENSIGGIPVIEDDHTLIGIVTNRDLRFEKNMGRSIEEVMTKENLVTATKNDDLSKAEDILQEHKIEKLPIVDDNKKLVGLITFRDIIKIRVSPNDCKDDLKIPDVRLSRPKNLVVYDNLKKIIYYIENVYADTKIKNYKEHYESVSKKFDLYEGFENITLPDQFTYKPNKNLIKSNTTKEKFKSLVKKVFI